MIVLPIKTQRLMLRPFRRSDVQAFHAYRIDPVLARYQGWQPMTEQQCHDFIERQLQALQNFGGDGHWLQIAVVRQDTEELIGDLGICAVSRKDGLLTLGFTLAQQHQRQGFATEACRALINNCLTTTPFRKIQAVTDLRNTAAIQLLKQLGFQLQQTKTAIFKGEACQEQSYILEKN